ncbi:hypothetical protein PsorP6_006225 [Peronosclerospora sorghi]|uniref:Uncharacterized protein n=1 Tax=Peronosclerospora sorghi TaxID=230839 RepID=A0ACC0W310_9STRA|nr:hypothetical protein PsorP6_006225 [Peronosclerospora sorghi]
MDSTYKTNRFGMPLLNIVGITATYGTFNAGFAFIPYETEEEYVWALENFSVVAVPADIVTDREISLMNAISRYLHFGTNSTSRGEGNHFVLKRYLKIANSDLLMVLKNLERLLAARFTDLNADMESEKLVIAHSHKMALCIRLSRRSLSLPSTRCFNNMKGFSQIGDNEACADMFLKDLGFPVNTRSRPKSKGGGKFDAHDFHSQWYLHQNSLFAESGGA